MCFKRQNLYSVTLYPVEETTIYYIEYNRTGKYGGATFVISPRSPIFVVVVVVVVQSRLTQLPPSRSTRFIGPIYLKI